MKLLSDLETLISDIVEVRLHDRCLPTELVEQLMDCSERLNRVHGALTRAKEIVDNLKPVVFS